MILIKSVLASVPNYYLYLFMIPVSIANRMEASFINLLWNDSEVHKRYHLIKLHNQALHGKWLWRFGEESDCLWRKVMVAKYGCNLVWDPKEYNGTHGLGI